MWGTRELALGAQGIYLHTMTEVSLLITETVLEIRYRLSLSTVLTMCRCVVCTKKMKAPRVLMPRWKLATM